MSLIAAFCLALGLWFLYDGRYGFPHKNEIFEAHHQFVQEGRPDEWPAFAQSRNWDPEPPERLYGRSDIMGQYLLGTLALLGAVWVAGRLVTSLKRTLRSDGDAVYSETGVRVPFTAMRRVDRKKWDSKGIAVVFYEENGRHRKLVLDDYKYAGGEQILEEVEQFLAAQSDSRVDS